MEAAVRDGENTEDGAIDGEPHQLAFLHDVDHPAAGEAADDKRSNEAQTEGERRDAVHRGGKTDLRYVLDVQQRFTENGWDDHQERELGQPFLLVAKQKSGGNGGSRAGKARKHGDGLSDADDEGVPAADFLPLTRFRKVGEGEQ